VNVPVEVAEVVARGVLAVVGELDAAAELAGPPLRQDRAAEDASRDEREVFQLLEELGVEERHDESPRRAWTGGPRLRDQASAGASTDSRASSMMSSAWIPSACPSKLRISRCRSAAGATARRSSRAT